MARAFGQEVIHAGNRGILGHDDHLDAGGVGIGEVHRLKAVLGDGHAGHAKGILARLHAGHDRVKVHIHNFQLVAELVANGLRDLYVDTGNFAGLVVIILIRREGSVGRHRQRGGLGHGRAHQKHGKNQKNAQQLFHVLSLQIYALSRFDVMIIHPFQRKCNKFRIDLTKYAQYVHKYSNIHLQRRLTSHARMGYDVHSTLGGGQ